jgi:hypothetical protein
VSLLGLAVALALSGCGSRPECTSHEVELARSGEVALRCGEVDLAVDWTGLLAGRPVPGAQRRSVQRGAVEIFEADPAAWRALLALMRADLAGLEGREGLEAGLGRSQAAWKALHGPEALPEGALRRALRTSVAPWARADVEGLVLTEIDIEGWIYYASLAHEVEGRGPLRLSVGDRLAFYRFVQGRFESGTPEERAALVGIGPFWWSARDRWASAPYAAQQAWREAAPIPRDALASDLAWAQALVEAGPAAHARSFHRHVGPLRLRARP